MNHETMTAKNPPVLTDPRGVALHSAQSSITRFIISIFLAFALLICLGAATNGFRRWEFPPLAIGLTIAAFIAWTVGGRLRYVPYVYATPSGLDLQWAWGDQRHIDWHEVLEVRVNRLSGPGPKRFRLYLADEALEFDARSDLPELIERFQNSASRPPVTS